MLNTITDSELIHELSLRIDQIKEENSKQELLMKELKKVNERLLHSEKIKSNFLSNIRNEINNPITSILGLTKALNDYEAGNELIKRLSGLIHSDAFSLDMQLRNIFLSAEIEAGNILVTPSKVNINDLIEAHLSAFQHIIDKKKIKISVAKNLKGEFITDPEYFSHIVSNLLSNATRFCNEGGSILIQSVLVNGRLDLSVYNTGTQISENNMQVIFDRFRQLEEGTTKTHSGHGLGLSIVKALLESLDGTISVHNEGDMVRFKVSINEFKTDAGINSLSSDGNDLLFIEEGSTVL